MKKAPHNGRGSGIGAPPKRGLGLLSVGSAFAFLLIVLISRAVLLGLLAFVGLLLRLRLAALALAFADHFQPAGLHEQVILPVGAAIDFDGRAGADLLILTSVADDNQLLAAVDEYG